MEHSESNIMITPEEQIIIAQNSRDLARMRALDQTTGVRIDRDTISLSSSLDALEREIEQTEAHIEEIIKAAEAEIAQLEKGE